LFTANEVKVADSTVALQISIYKLDTVTSKLGVKISKAKQKQWLLKEEIQ